MTVSVKGSTLLLVTLAEKAEDMERDLEEPDDWSLLTLDRFEWSR